MKGHVFLLASLSKAGTVTYKVLPLTLPDLSTLPPQCTTWISIHFRLSPAITIWHHVELRQPDLLIGKFLASKLGILLEGFTLHLHLQKD